MREKLLQLYLHNLPVFLQGAVVLTYWPLYYCSYSEVRANDLWGWEMILVFEGCGVVWMDDTVSYKDDCLLFGLLNCIYVSSRIAY